MQQSPSGPRRGANAVPGRTQKPVVTEYGPGWLSPLPSEIFTRQKRHASIDAPTYKCVCDGQGTEGLVRSLFTQFLPALTSIPPTGGGLSRLTYWKVSKG